MSEYIMRMIREAKGNCCLLLFVFAFQFMIQPLAFAADIDYSGDGSVLETAPDASGTSDSFFAYQNNDPTDPIASGNSVTIDFVTGGNTNPYRVFGGVSKTESTDNNTVYMINGTVDNRIYGGYATTAGFGASGNRIIMSGGTVQADIFGTYTADGDSRRNHVEISGGTVVGDITGGRANGDGSASLNTVTITAGRIGGHVYGGNAGGSGNAEGNDVSISDASANIVGTVYSGFANAGDANNNTATVSAGTVNSVYGGLTNTAGDASYNEVVVSTSAAITGTIAGGAVMSSGDAIGNTVKVSNITGTHAFLLGGTTSSGTSTNNRLIIENASFSTAHSGVTFSTGDASSNSLSATNVTAQTLYGGTSHQAASHDNIVNFYSGTIGHSDTTGTIIGGSGYNATYNNTVNIYGGTIGKDAVVTQASAVVYGGLGSSGIGDVSNNKVNIYDGVIGDSGQYAFVYGGDSSGTGTNVYSNTVTLAGGTVGNGGTIGYIYGGRQSSTVSGDAYSNSVNITGGSVDTVYGGLSRAGDAFENKISVSGGTVNGWIIGGYVYGTEAKDNVVTLSGTPDLVNAHLEGWRGASTFSGNTLEIHEYNGTSVKGMGNFEIYDFLIQTSLVNGRAALAVIDASDISDSEIRVNFSTGGDTLHAGERITLINDTGALTSTGINSSTLARHGALLLYDLDISADANNVYIDVSSGKATPEAKSVSEGRIGSLAFVNQGHDLIVDSGFEAANAYLGRTGDGWSTPAFFGVVGGGHFRHKTGSHVDVDGVSTLLGMTWRNNGPCGSLLLGAFFEAGYADYDTHNAFASGAVRGDGDSRYFGGGFMARYDWQNGFYAEATGRVGAVKNKFHSDLTDLSGNRAKYDINSPYFGAHVGVGYKWQLNEKAILDLSAKYLWSRQNSDSAVVTGSRVNFDATNSHRIRTGARFAYAISDCIAPYVGAAFEYEFNGKARGAVSNYNFGAPSLKGGTGIGEIGVTMRHNNFSADLGVQGHVGRRDGVTGSLRAGWTF